MISKKNFLNNSNHANNKGENHWDDGWRGNYWDDYEERYPDARKTLRGIWNRQYEIEENAIDRYPLIDEYTNSLIKWKLDGHYISIMLLLQRIFDFSTYKSQ